MDVAVVVVGYNDSGWLEPCLRSVLKEIRPGSVYYVDNASGDGSAGLVSDLFPGVHVVRNTVNRGFAGGNNQVLSTLVRGVGYRYVFLLNPDTVVPAGLIAGLRGFMEEFTQYGAIGPLQTEYDAKGVSDRLNRVSRRDVEIGKYHILRRWIPGVNLQVDREAPDGLLGVYYVQGSAFFARLDLFRDIGYFDEIYHAFYEEVDLCRRALWHGYKLGLITSLRLSHASRGADNGSRYRIYYRIRNKYLFILTDPDLAIRRLPWIVVRLIGADLRQIPGSSASTEFSVLSFGRAVLWLLVHARHIARGRSRRNSMVTSTGHWATTPDPDH